MIKYHLSKMKISSRSITDVGENILPIPSLLSSRRKYADLKPSEIKIGPVIRATFPESWIYEIIQKYVKCFPPSKIVTNGSRMFIVCFNDESY